MQENFHASAVVLADRGIVIAGPSGTGKTQLALALLSHAAAAGCFARLVSDDQIFLSRYGGRLICKTPPTIAGLVEIRGSGPRSISHEAKSPVDLLVRLVQPREAERFPADATERLLGCEVPLLRLSAGDRQAAVMAVLGRLGLAPFG